MCLIQSNAGYVGDVQMKKFIRSFLNYLKYGAKLRSFLVFCPICCCCFDQNFLVELHKEQVCSHICLMIF